MNLNLQMKAEVEIQEEKKALPYLHVQILFKQKNC